MPSIYTLEKSFKQFFLVAQALKAKDLLRKCNYILSLKFIISQKLKRLMTFDVIRIYTRFL